ncbi:MAG: alanine--glyoxylate aminotransferase family protein [Oscillospiraceae bacterium]|nr:alanine--glyoxylate aminotransferase family protein [Oscillospiraceae bacterium]
MFDEKLLMTPGPTMIPTRVLEIMRRQIIHHRTANYEKSFDELCENLKLVFRTKNTVMTFACSGTGLMEAAVANLFSPGDKVLAVTIGVFGERFADIARAFGLDVQVLAYEWGKPADPAEIKKILDTDHAHKIKGVLMTHNETSTGVTNDIKAVAELTRDTDRILAVDAISSLGALELEMDGWGIDAVVTCSQKALMNAPGLGFAALSDKGWAAYEKSKLPKYYWDFKKYRDGIAKISENPPFTPAITLVLAQNEAVKILLEEGLENVYARHKRHALAAQAGVAALGLSLLPEQRHSSYVITAVKPPEGESGGSGLGSGLGSSLGIDGVIKDLNISYDVMVVGGQKGLKGKLLRIGHCGYFNRFDLIRTFSALELSLAKAGHKIESGASLAAIQKALA